MSDQTREKEKSLAELMVRILKEPLKPLGASVKGLEGGLADLKEEIELVNGSVGECQSHSQAAARRSKDVLEVLEKLQHDQAERLSALLATVERQAQAGRETLDARWEEGLAALGRSEGRVLDALVGLGAVQERIERSLALLPEQLVEQRAALDRALAQCQSTVTAANAAITAGFGTAVVEIEQRLERQYKSALALSQKQHQALAKELEGGTQQTHSALAGQLQAGQVLADAFATGHAGIISALQQQTEALNARLDQSQASLRRLGWSTGLTGLTLLACIGYAWFSRIA